MPSDERETGWFGVEWRHLAALQAVAEEGSFTRAAQRLGYSQSAISQQIAVLERHVGGALIDRKRPGSTRLTEAGERLASHSKAISARLRSAQDDVKAAVEGRAALRLGVFPSVGARVLPPLLRRFTQEWVGVRVSLSESWSDKEMLERLQRGELDLAFATMPLESGPFVGRVVTTDRYVLVCSRELDLARHAAVSLAALADVPLLSLHQQQPVEALLRAHGIEPNIAFRSDDNQTLLALVAEGLGAAIVPRLTVDTNDSRLVEVEVEEKLPERAIALAWSSERELSTAAQAFIDTATGSTSPSSSTNAPKV